MKKCIYLAAIALLLVATTACSDKESEIGLNLVDPATLYNGKTATFYANEAYSLIDDSLRTSNYGYGIIGNLDDPLYGKVSSTLYTQIGLASGTSSINFDEVTIDSVVLTFVISELYPDTSGVYSFHFEVAQLAEQVMTDSIYYSWDVLPVQSDKVFFDDVVSVDAHDTIVSLKMSPSIKEVLSQTGESEEFIAATKGLRIRIVDDSDEGMMGINFAALQTCLSAYYHYGSDSNSYHYDFLVGYGAAHFTNFSHDYSGTTFGGSQMAGNTNLYLTPLAGYNVRLNFDNDLQAFRAAHPLAVIHHAELLMPVSSDVTSIPMPDQIVVNRCTDSSDTYIDDYIDAYTYHGYDGSYDSERGLYRARITEHFQNILREGRDPGMTLVLNSRRSSARYTKLNGSADSNPVRIEIVYTE